MNIRQIYRSLTRDWLNTAVIVVSISAGIACTSLISVFISRELRTDDFQMNVDRIYLLKCDDPFNKGEQMSVCRLGAAEYMKQNYPEVEDFCRVKTYYAQRITVNGQTYYDKPTICEASPNFFSFFSYRLLTNNKGSLLETKNDIAISEGLAFKYFGNSSPLGQVITLRKGSKDYELVIKGVFEKPKDNSLLHFDIVKYGPESEETAFLLLKQGANPDKLEMAFANDRSKIPVIGESTPGRYYLESLKKAYFDGGLQSAFSSLRDKTDLLIAFLIGLMILFIASFNYLGLVRNKLLLKNEEFTVRLINGGSKSSLVEYFMLENLVIIFFAFFPGLLLMYLAMPLFNDLVGSHIDFSYFFRIDGLLIFSGLIGFFLIITLLFSVLKIDTQSLRIAGAKGGRAVQIPSFNIFQISVSIILLVTTLFIIKQMRYISSKDIGIDKSVIEVRLPAQFADKTKVFREEILKSPSISQVSVTTASPLLEYWMVLLHYNENGNEKQYTPTIFNGDENFISTLGITMLEGKNFSGNEAADKNSCIINESLARKFAGQSLLGAKLPGDDEATVIGIVKDFHCSSLKNDISPGYIVFSNSGYHLLVKPADGLIPEAHRAILDTWKNLVPDYPLDIETVGERFEWYHRENGKYAKLIGSCCFISLFLSMIGLFAISVNSGSRRTKEIGIRKVNGATISEVVFLLNKDFAKWVITAFLIAIPIDWYLMHRWLESFAYKTVLSWWVFAMAGVLTLLVVFLTTSWQSLRAATCNPVEALRYE
jgi:putative ABC transport system permease protein